MRSAFCQFLLLLGMAVLANSCQDHPSEVGQVDTIPARTLPTTAQLATPRPPVAHLASPSGEAQKNNTESVPAWYRFEDDTLRQTLRVEQISTRTIRFRLLDSLKTTGKYRLLEGTATALPGDPEIDEGADGTAYPSIAYNYQGACFLSVRIELDTKQRVQLSSDNCQTGHADGTFEHGGILHRVTSGK